MMHIRWACHSRAHRCLGMVMKKNYATLVNVRKFHTHVLILLYCLPGMGTKGREMATNDQGGHGHDSYLSAVQFFLIKKHPDAFNFTHQMG